MKIIRMTKTMAGPNGLYSAGLVRTVDDGTAAWLIGSDAAILAPGVVQPPADCTPPQGSLWDPPQLGEGSHETAALEAGPETAVAKKPLRRKEAK